MNPRNSSLNHHTLLGLEWKDELIQENRLQGRRLGFRNKNGLIWGRFEWVMGFLELGELRECVCVWGGREENERERNGHYPKQPKFKIRKHATTPCHLTVVSSYPVTSSHVSHTSRYPKDGLVSLINTTSSVSLRNQLTRSISQERASSYTPSDFIFFIVFPANL